MDFMLKSKLWMKKISHLKCMFGVFSSYAYRKCQCGNIINLYYITRKKNVMNKTDRNHNGKCVQQWIIICKLMG